LPVYWGKVSDRSQYALFALPVAFTWLMALMGYIRSSVRTHWHVYTVMKDNSPENFIPTLQTVGNMVTGITLLFLIFVLFIFWIANLSGTKQIPPATDGGLTAAENTA
jgi:cytochrome bd-type quinol oxidase subunit 1